MKIITAERRTLNGEPVDTDALKRNTEDYRDYWCKIETDEEYLVYNKCLQSDGREAIKLWSIWNDMVINAGRPEGLAWGEDDVYGYIEPYKELPEVGGEFTEIDGDRWVRIA